MGCIAQLVEQLTLNQRAAGSSPAAPTILLRGTSHKLADAVVFGVADIDRTAGADDGAVRAAEPGGGGRAAVPGMRRIADTALLEVLTSRPRKRGPERPEKPRPVDSCFRRNDD